MCIACPQPMGERVVTLRVGRSSLCSRALPLRGGGANLPGRGGAISPIGGGGGLQMWGTPPKECWAMVREHKTRSAQSAERSVARQWPTRP